METAPVMTSPLQLQHRPLLRAIDPPAAEATAHRPYRAVELLRALAGPDSIPPPQQDRRRRRSRRR
ncbi:MAG: hypothetical protein ABIP03_02855 [Aquihabitans sp.]